MQLTCKICRLWSTIQNFFPLWNKCLFSDGVELNSISKNNKTEGNKLKIACNGESYPVMTENNVRWSKQNNNTFWINGSHLEIKHVNRVDSGTYICTVVITLTPTVGHSVKVTGTSTVEVDILCKFYIII